MKLAPIVPPLPDVSVPVMGLHSSRSLLRKVIYSDSERTFS